MKPSDNNPYSTPSSDLATDVDSSQRMHNFSRFSAWGVFGLSIITLGLYYIYWLFTRTQLINRVHHDKISDTLVYSVLGLMLVNIALSFLSGMYEQNADYELAANISSLVYSISSLFWIFAVRNRIHQMSDASQLNGYWLGGVMTFLFQVLYMQYKINEYIDTHPTTIREETKLQA